MINVFLAGTAVTNRVAQSIYTQRRWA